MWGNRRFLPHVERPKGADFPPQRTPSKIKDQSKDWSFILVGVRRLELLASWSRTKRATKLRYTPM